MTEVLRAGTPVDHAWAAATKAAAAGDLVINDHLDDRGIRQAQAVIAAVWHTNERDTLASTEMLHAFTHSGNYVVLAVRGGAAVGAAIGFLGRGADGPYLHSH